MEMPVPRNSNDPNLPQGCLRRLIASFVGRALTKGGSKKCNLMDAPIGNRRRSSDVSGYMRACYTTQWELCHLVDLRPDVVILQVAFLLSHFYARDHQGNSILLSIQAVHSLIWWSLNRSAQIQAMWLSYVIIGYQHFPRAPHQRLSFLKH